MSAVCEWHDVEHLVVLGCPECANEACLAERIVARHSAATMPPSAADALAEATARRMAQEGEAGVRFDLLMARLEESAQNREDIRNG